MGQDADLGTEAKEEVLHLEETRKSSEGWPQTSMPALGGWMGRNLLGAKGWGGVVTSIWLKQVAHNRGSLTDQEVISVMICTDLRRERSPLDQ